MASSKEIGCIPKKQRRIPGRNLFALAFAGSAALTSSVVSPNYPQPFSSQATGKTHNPIHNKSAKAHEPRKNEVVMKGHHLHSSSRTSASIHDSHPRVSHRNNMRKLNSTGTPDRAKYNKPRQTKSQKTFDLQGSTLPELITHYSQHPESFIQLALNTNLTIDQARERKMLAGIETAISGKFEQRLARKVSKAFESKLNGQLTLLAKGQIDKKSFQDIMQEQVSGFSDYLKEQKAQGLPNLESITLAGLLLVSSVSAINLRKDIFSQKNRLRLAAALTVFNLIVTACGADQTIIDPGSKILDTQEICTVVGTTSPTGITAESLLKAQKENPGIYVAGAIFLLGKSNTADTPSLLEHYFGKTIPARMLTEKLDFRIVNKDLPNNTREVQNSILRFFLGEGDRSLAWNNVMSVTGETKYSSVLTDINTGALVNGKYSLVGYATDLWQTKSNIGRSLLVVRNNQTGFEYVLKVQPINVAQTEVNGLTALYRNGISVAQVETYMPNKAKYLSVSIQPYIRGGITVADYLNPRTPEIKGVNMKSIEAFYKSLYSAVVREAGAPSQNGKSLVIGDLPNIANTVVTPEGKLVVIDANAGIHPVTVKPVYGKYLVSGPKVGFTGMAGAVIKDFQYFMQVTFGTKPDELPTISPLESNNLTQLKDLPSNATTRVKFTNPNGTTEFEATVKNNGVKLVTIPDKIPLSRWELLNSTLNGALIIVAGASAGYVFVHEMGLGDRLVLTQSPSLTDRGRFGLDGKEMDDFETITGVNNIDTRTFRGWEIPLEFITDTALPNAEWIDGVRGDLKLPKSTGELIPELRLTTPDPLGNSIVLNNVVFGTDTYGPHVKFSFPDCGIKDQRIYIDYGSLAHYTMFTRKNADDPTSIIKYDEDLADYVYHLTSYSDLQKKLTEEMRSGRMLFAVPVKSKDIRGREATNLVYGVLVEGEDGSLNLEMFFLTSKRIFDHPLLKVKAPKSKSGPELGTQLVVLERIQK